MIDLRKIVGILLTVAIVLTIGCSNDSSEQVNNLKEQLDSANAKIDELEKSLEDKTAEANLLEDNITIMTRNMMQVGDELQFLHERDALIRELLDEQSYISTYMKDQYFIEKYHVIPVYVMDIDTGERVIAYHIIIPKNEPLGRQLETISIKLSKYQYHSNPVTLMEIKEEDGMRIAYINLAERDIATESPNYYSLGSTWKSGFLQGSTGGQATAMNLIETFLQKDLELDWIDGVRFVYEGDLERSFEHAEQIFDITFRE